MKNLGRCCIFVLAFATVAAIGACSRTSGTPAQRNDASAGPLASPPAMVETTLDGAKITIHYNSPSIRGRKIMGSLVPYGQEWRTGANPATSFVTAANLKIGTLSVSAGHYTLFTLPAAPGTPWLLILSKKTGEWGIPYPAGDDLGRTPMHYDKLPAPQESMTISFEKTMKNSTELHIKWETTDEWVSIIAEK